MPSRFYPREAGAGSVGLGEVDLSRRGARAAHAGPGARLPHRGDHPDGGLGLLLDPGLAFGVPAPARQQEAAAAAAQEGRTAVTAPGAVPASPAPEAQTVNGFTVQFATPNAALVDASVAAVRSAAGVRGAATSSIAIGGTSVMRVSFAGDVNALAEALRARGFQVNNVAGILVIRR